MAATNSKTTLETAHKVKKLRLEKKTPSQKPSAGKNPYMLWRQSLVVEGTRINNKDDAKRWYALPQETNDI